MKLISTFFHLCLSLLLYISPVSHIVGNPQLILSIRKSTIDFIYFLVLILDEIKRWLVVEEINCGCLMMSILQCPVYLWFMTEWRCQMEQLDYLLPTLALLSECNIIFSLEVLYKLTHWNIRPFILFSYFDRTDFYRLMKSKDDKLGFPPGVAAKILLSVSIVGFCNIQHGLP